MLEIVFEIHLLIDGDLAQIPEELLQAQPLHYAQLIKENRSLDGMLKIRTEQGEIELADDLSSLVQRLCFGTSSFFYKHPASIFRYDFFSQDEFFLIKQAQDQASLFIQDEPELIVSKIDLAKSLFDCGNRFLELLDTFGSDFYQLKEYLQAFADEAKVYLDNLLGA